MADGGQGNVRRELGGTVGASRMGPSVRKSSRGVGVLQPTDPTDPEVPAAKRQRAARRQLTVIVAGAAVVALLLAVLALLYRMEQQVTTARPAANGVAHGAASVEVPPEDFVKAPAIGNPEHPTPNIE